MCRGVIDVSGGFDMGVSGDMDVSGGFVSWEFILESVVGCGCVGGELKPWELYFVAGLKGSCREFA